MPKQKYILGLVAGRSLLQGLGNGLAPTDREEETSQSRIAKRPKQGSKGDRDSANLYLKTKKNELTAGISSWALGHGDGQGARE